MFQIRERNSSVAREILGGMTTFMAMSYILFVQVGMLGSAGVGMDSGGVLMAVCIASGAACIVMGLLANYPIALAPGMGQNFFFVAMAASLSAWEVSAEGYQMALALTVVAGSAFVLISLVGLRARVLNSLPDALKTGIAAGIGLLIARVGFGMGGLEDAFVRAGNWSRPEAAISAFFTNPAAWVTLAGLLIIVVLVRFRVHGAVLLAILACVGINILIGRAEATSPFQMPSGIEHTAGSFFSGLGGLWQGVTGPQWASYLQQGVVLLIVLLFLDLFDTVGTLVAVANRAGLMHEGRLPRAQQALGADAFGTVVGGMLGTSTVTSYIESVTGIQAGARTGLAAIVAGLLLLGGMFCMPLIHMAIGDYGTGLYPALAPALIFVGGMMLRTVRELDFDDATEYVPVLLILVTMPLTMSIANGIAIGFVSYAAGKLLTGRLGQCPLLVYVCAILFVLRYAWPVL
jgi:AGZA family xanthine/uracil permease-like MFS transporter